MLTAVFIPNTAPIHKAPIVERREIFRAYENATRPYRVKGTEAEKRQTQEAHRASSNNFKIRQLVYERCTVDWD
jgi:hypothetical protein